jgi:hypothetical protein
LPRPSACHVTRDRATVLRVPRGSERLCLRRLRPGGRLAPHCLSSSYRARSRQGRRFFSAAEGFSLYEGLRSQALSDPRAPISSLVAISLVRPRRRLSPAPTAARSSRRAQHASRLAALQRPPEGLCLDACEHDGTLVRSGLAFCPSVAHGLVHHTRARTMVVGMTFEGSPAVGRVEIAPQPCIRWVVLTQTMMHACASAAKLRGGGPILNGGMAAMDKRGTPPTRTDISCPSTTRE